MRLSLDSQSINHLKEFKPHVTNDKKRVFKKTSRLQINY